MARRKRTSLRRWKARCWLEREIPAWAIVDYHLTRWFTFAPVDGNRDMHIARYRGWANG